MKFVSPTQVTHDIKELRDMARYKIVCDYFGLFDENQVIGSCYTIDDAVFIVDLLNEAMEDRPFAFNYKLVDVYNENLDELTPDLFAPCEVRVNRRSSATSEACGISRLERKMKEARSFFHVPGVPGDTAYIVELGADGKRCIREGVIVDITCRKRKDSFCVKFLVNLEEGLCITQKEFIYGIDVFVSHYEALAAIEILEVDHE